MQLADEKYLKISEVYSLISAWCTHVRIIVRISWEDTHRFFFIWSKISLGVSIRGDKLALH